MKNFILPTLSEQERQILADSSRELKAALYIVANEILLRQKNLEAEQNHKNEKSKKHKKKISDFERNLNFILGDPNPGKTVARKKEKESQKRRAKQIKNRTERLQKTVDHLLKELPKMENIRPQGVESSVGGIMVGNKPVLILHDHVEAVKKRSSEAGGQKVDTVPEEKAAVAAIHIVMTLFKQQGIGALAPLISDAELPENSPSNQPLRGLLGGKYFPIALAAH